MCASGDGGSANIGAGIAGGAGSHLGAPPGMGIGTKGGDDISGPRLSRPPSISSKLICFLGRGSGGLDGWPEGSGIPGRGGPGTGPGKAPGKAFAIWQGKNAGAAAERGLGCISGSHCTSSKQSGVTKTSRGSGGGASSASSAAVESSECSVSETNFLDP